MIYSIPEMFWTTICMQVESRIASMQIDFPLLEIDRGSPTDYDDLIDIMISGADSLVC